MSSAIPTNPAGQFAPTMLKRRESMSGDSAEDALAWLCETCGAAAVKAVIAAAHSGDVRSITVVKLGLAARLMVTPDLLDMFMNGLLGREPPPLCAPLLQAYLTSLSPAQRHDFFDPATTVSKAHPARLALSGASFNTANGRTFLAALQVLMAHGFDGASFAAVVKRCDKELARACLDCNREFRDTLGSELVELPRTVLRQVLESPRCTKEALDFLVEHWGLSFDKPLKVALSDCGHQMVSSYQKHLVLRRPKSAGSDRQR
jgi:hypothetical protein